FNQSLIVAAGVLHSLARILRDLHTRRMISPTPRVGKVVVLAGRHLDLEDSSRAALHIKIALVHPNVRHGHSPRSERRIIPIHDEGREIVMATIQYIDCVGYGPGDILNLTHI